MIIIASHAVFAADGEPVHGTGSEIGAFLQQKGLDYLFIKHSLYGGFFTLVDKFLGRKLIAISCGLKNLPFPLRIIQEQIINFYFVFKEKKIKLFIGIDPLNAFSGILAKKIGRVEKTVFYTADYAHQRFENSFLNWIYHWFDQFAIKHADQVWNVSTRITELREKQGVPRKKNFFVPNTPIFKKVKRLPYSCINKHDLVVVSNLTRSLNYPLIFKAVKKLSSRYPDMRLIIIGQGPYEKELKKIVHKMRMGKRVLFLGRKSHEEVLKILAKSAIGIAPYTSEEPWREFCDSLKIREYFACGLPVITTNISSTADDVSKFQAGFVIKIRKEEFIRAIDQLFSDKKLYLKMRRNGINLAKKYDFFKVINKTFKELGIL